MRERTILIGGFSKDYAMCGWRIGYACGPEDLIQAMLVAHQYILMCIGTTAQDAAIVALQEGRPFVEQMVADYDRRRKLMVKGLNQIGLPTVEPKGAFYVFPKVDVTGLSDEAFAEQLLMEEHVALVPGSAFGEAGRGFVRCSYATAYDQLEDALERIERFVTKVKG
jgi:aminotransferase